MQILVVVANIQVRILKTEVGKGFARTVFDRESVDPEAQINLENQAIGFWEGSNTLSEVNLFCLLVSKGNQG